MESVEQEVNGTSSRVVEADEHPRLHVCCKEFRRKTGEAIQDLLREMAPDCNVSVSYKMPDARFCFVELSSQDESARFRTLVEGKPCYGGGSPVEVRPATRRVEREESEALLPPKKRQRTLEEGGVPLLELRQRLARPSAELSLRDRVTPLACVPYDRQLTLKEEYVRTALRRLPRKLRDDAEAVGDSAPTWAIGARDVSCCTLEPALPAPLGARERYRTQCTYTIGFNGEGCMEVGFVRTRSSDGEPVVESPDSLDVLAPALLVVRAALRRCVEASMDEWPPVSRASGSGVWRLVSARVNSQNEVLLLVQTSGLGELEFPLLRERLTHHLTPEGSLSQHPEAQSVCTRVVVVSLFVQLCPEGVGGDAIDSGSVPLHVAGSMHLGVELCGVSVRVGPLSFLQVNPPACEVLYAKVFEWLAPQAQPLLLDLCCGVGAFAVAAARHFREVRGVEVVEEAVALARESATRAGVQEAVTFVAGRVEDQLPALLAEGGDCCAFADPPRTGLGRSTLLALRRHAPLRRIVYAACDPERFAGEASVLCAFGEEGEPFVPTRCCAVDMFPLTAHCEMLVLLERGASATQAPITTGV